MLSISILHYDVARPKAFSKLRKLQLAKAGLKTSADVMKEWLENQDAYTIHRPVRKRFARNPYTVSNLMDVWECDRLDVQAYAKYNDNYRYILSVIDVFSKYRQLIPLWTKSGPLVPRRFGPYSMTRKVGAAQYGCALIMGKGISKYTFSGHVTGRRHAVSVAPKTPN